MRIRITGTREELAAAVHAVSKVLVVREVIQCYPDRGASVLGRVYLDDVEAPAAGVVVPPLVVS